MALINYITRIQFGYGSLGLLAQECQAAGIRRPLVVTDKGVRAAGILDTVLRELPPGVDAGIFDGTVGNPNELPDRLIEL